MNVFLKKLIDQGFMKEEQGQYIEKAVNEKNCFIISGHKGWGILPLMASISAVAKSKYKIKQVKGFDNLSGETDYFLIADLSDIDYAKLITEAILVPDTSFISLKDPDHPYSILKILKDVYKSKGHITKTIQVLECAKIDDKNKLTKITQIIMKDDGKLKKTDFK